MNALSEVSAEEVVETIIRGFPSSAAPEVVYPLAEDSNGDGTIQPTEDIPPYDVDNVDVSNPTWAPHYLCEDTGLIDGGATDDGTLSASPALASNSCGLAANQVCDDGGPGSTGAECDFGTDFTDCGARFEQDTREECPAGSRVIYFLAKTDLLTQSDVAGLSCQNSGSCFDKLQDLAAKDVCTA